MPTEKYILKFTFPVDCSQGKDQQKVSVHVWFILVNTGMLQPLLHLAFINPFFSPLFENFTVMKCSKCHHNGPMLIRRSFTGKEF